MAVSPETKQQLASNGVAVTAVTGGPQKRRYYTPVGEEVWGIPAIRKWVKKELETGKVLATGERDANLDRGWLTEPPTELKLACAGCSRWHDTVEEIERCIALRAEKDKEWERKARVQWDQEHGSDDETSERLDALETGLTRIEGLLEQLVAQER